MNLQNPDPVYPKTNMAVGYRVDESWPARPLPAAWGGVSAVAVDSLDQVWIFNRGEIPVQAFSRDGKRIAAWGQGLFSGPHGLRLDRDGNLWVTDVQLHVVQRFTPKGELLLTLGTRGEPGEDERHFNRPTDVAPAPDGGIVITDGYVNNRLVHFDAAGRFVKSQGRLGSRPGEFSLPHAAVFDSRGRLYVCDRNNARIQVFERDGTFLAEWRNLVIPWGICVTRRDEILVCGTSPARWGQERILGSPPSDQLVMKFTADGHMQELWAFPLGREGKERPGELNWLHGIAVDSHDDLYLGDIKGCRVQRFLRLATP